MDRLLIPFTNAPAYIGHVNPGVGYWWTQTNGVWCVCVPVRPVEDAFWPVFVVSLVILGGLTWLVVHGRSQGYERRFGALWTGSADSKGPALWRGPGVRSPSRRRLRRTGVQRVPTLWRGDWGRESPAEK